MIAVLVVAAVGVAVRRAPEAVGPAPAPAAGAAPAVPPATPVELSSLSYAGGEPQHRDKTVGDVVDAISRYVQQATDIPLRTGRAGPRLGALFTDASRPRLDTGDRATLVDEGLPRPASTEVVRAHAGLTLLTRPGGGAEIAVATIDVVVRGIGGETGSLWLRRTGELILVPAPQGWLIDGFELAVAVDTSPHLPLDDLLWPFGPGGDPAARPAGGR